MKYMNFDRSYSYTGLANLLEDYNIDIEDYELVKAMKLAYIFKYDLDTNQYISGTSLQDKKYFDYYLNPLGLELVEKTVDKENFINLLRNFKRRCFLDLNLAGKKKKLIFEHYDISRESFIFLNIRPKDPEEAMYFEYKEKQLLLLLNEDVYFYYISYKKGDYIQEPYGEMEDSRRVLDRYFQELKEYMEEPRPVASIRRSEESLFRVFFEDLYISMDLLGHSDLKNSIGKLREDFELALDRKKIIILADYLDLEELRLVLDDYSKIIENENKSII